MLYGHSLFFYLAITYREGGYEIGHVRPFVCLFQLWLSTLIFECVYQIITIYHNEPPDA